MKDVQETQELSLRDVEASLDSGRHTPGTSFPALVAENEQQIYEGQSSDTLHCSSELLMKLVERQSSETNVWNPKEVQAFIQSTQAGDVATTASSPPGPAATLQDFDVQCDVLSPGSTLTLAQDIAREIKDAQVVIQQLQGDYEAKKKQELQQLTRESQARIQAMKDRKAKKAHLAFWGDQLQMLQTPSKTLQTSLTSEKIQELLSEPEFAQIRMQMPNYVNSLYKLLQCQQVSGSVGLQEALLSHFLSYKMFYLRMEMAGAKALKPISYNLIVTLLLACGIEPCPNSNGGNPIRVMLKRAEIPFEAPEKEKTSYFSTFNMTISSILFVIGTILTVIALQ